MNITNRLVDAGLDVDLAGLAGTPGRWMRLAADGRLPKAVLASTLAPESRSEFLDACAGIERALTEACAAKKDFCLESGCALEGEVCLEAVLKADAGYHRACAAKWLVVFTDPHNRIDAWKA